MVVLLWIMVRPQKDAINSPHLRGWQWQADS